MTKLSSRIDVKVIICFFISLVISGTFLVFLGNEEVPYMYAFYAIVGVTIYLAAKLFGIEIYFLAILPKIFFAMNILMPIFNISYNNVDLQNPMKVHAITIVWIVIFALEFFELIAKNEFIVDKCIVLAFAVLFVFTGITFIARGGSGIGLLVDNYYMSFSFFIFFYMKRKQIDFEKIKLFMRVFLICIFILGLYGLIEYIAKDNPFSHFFVADIVQNSAAEKQYRTFATVGHIIFPQIMLMGCFLVRHNVQKVWIRAIMYAFLVIAGSMSQARALILVTIAYIFIVEFASIFIKNRKDKKTITIALVILFVLVCIGGVILIATPIGNQIISRFVSDAGSAGARLIHINYLKEHFTDLSLLGIGGFAASVVLYNESGVPVIAEIPWINLYFEVGPFLLLFIAFIIVLIIKGSLKIEIILLLISMSAYTTFTSKNQCMFMLIFLATYSVLLNDYRLNITQPHRVKVNNPEAMIKKMFTDKSDVKSFVAALVVLCIFVGIISSIFVNNSVEKKYNAISELYISPIVVDEEDIAFLQEERSYMLQINRHLTNDVVQFVRTDAVMDRAKAMFYERTGNTIELTPDELMFRLFVTNVNDTRTIRIEYVNSDAETASEFANCLATATIEYTRELFGVEVTITLAEAIVPTTHVAPNIQALIIIAVIFSALIFYVLFMLVFLFKNSNENNARKKSKNTEEYSEKCILKTAEMK